MLFSSVVGQQLAKGGILNMWKNNVFPHALLIVGGEGTGGLPMALALAQYIFCENKSSTDSCGKCAGCSKALRLEHADLHLTFPAIPPKPNTKALSRYYINEFKEFIKQTPYGTTYDWLQHINAENKQGNIPAEECREIINVLNLKSYEGGKKVQIIWRPEYLGKEGNILLKLIEEPPPDTIIIFVAENTEDILLTIRSRTQMVRLAPIPATFIANSLIERQLAEPPKAEQIGLLAMGSYTDALNLIRHTENDLFSSVKELFNHLFTHNGAGLAKYVDGWSKQGREQQKNLLNYIIHLLEQTIRTRHIPTIPTKLPAAEAEFVKKLAVTKITFLGFEQMIATVTETTYHIERNAHSKTQLHAMVVKMEYAILNKPIII